MRDVTSPGDAMGVGYGMRCMVPVAMLPFAWISTRLPNAASHFKRSVVSP
ncbi:MAG: hypothetical protein MUF20_06925 [Methylotetracoccus sp.]|jgi:hypothetical protein|nr:hypothetical protein [Methylotetracoccus sp.]